MTDSATDLSLVRRFVRQQPARPARDISVGTGLITFDGEGNLDRHHEQPRDDRAAQHPVVRPAGVRSRFLAGLRPLDRAPARWPPPGRTARPPARSRASSSAKTARIRGVFTSGVTRDLGQIRLARFANPAGLEQRGQNLFAQGVNSGLPIEGDPGDARHRHDHRRRRRALEHRHRQEPDRPGPGHHAIPRQRPRDHRRPAAARRTAEPAAVGIWFPSSAWEPRSGSSASCLSGEAELRGRACPSGAWAREVARPATGFSDYSSQLTPGRRLPIT